MKEKETMQTKSKHYGSIVFYDYVPFFLLQ